ncbi:MAG: serine/threonine protein kinase [Archangium sp.]|nr:serine/threonine protein kinase [Archangium sp.]
MTCPSENDLLAFVAGATENRGDVESHLVGCERCRVAVASLVSQTAAPSRPSGLQQRGDTVGRYVVLELVGEGAMGRVYAAYDPVLDRKVALKLLHPLVDGPEGQQRLLREAKALAKVAHPNLVGVHDAGAFRDSVFIAMEFVEGTTLRAWLKAERRSEALTLDAFRQAARGLAAAHDAGLVHRDFKPENVLVGADGRVRVSDFGLARESGAALSVTSLEAPALTDPSSLQTATGALVGTPAYMAPEQLLGRRADAKADQFAFCVALAEGLSGARPFAKNTLDVVSAGAKLTGPTRVVRALTRGLSAAPEKRFGSMHELLSALEPRSVRPLAFVLPAVAALAIGAGVVVSVRQRNELCASGPSRVAAVWTNDRRHSLEQHFSTLGGGATFTRIADELDRWGTQWAQVHREACEATRLRGEQSDQLLTVRMACLERRLLEVDGALGVLATTDTNSLPRAQDAILSLTPLTVCSNATALLSPSPRPEQPAVVARVERVERELARAQALKDAGRFKEGLPIATSAALEAHAIGWAPLEAEALLVRGLLLDGGGDYAAAEPTLRDAWARAHAAKDDRLAMLAAIELAFVLNELARMKDAEEWVWQAEALRPRIGNDWEMDSKIATQQGHLLFTRTDFAGAEVRYRTAWELRRDHQGPAHPKTVTMLANLANAIGGQGRYEESVKLLIESATLLEQSLGRSHHKVGQANNAVAEKLVALHRPAEALARIDAIFPEQEQVLGAKNQYVARLHLGRAEALRALERNDEALVAYEKALTTFEAAAMPLMVGVTLSAIAATHCASHHLDEGLAAAHRSRKLFVDTFGPEHEEATVALEVEGECLLSNGQAKAALPVFTQALTEREKAQDAPWEAMAVSGLGRTQLALGQKALAAATLERAVKSLEASKLDDELLEKTRKALATAR